MSINTNKIFFNLVKYVASEQSNVDWFFKSSLLFVTGLHKELMQEQTVNTDNFNNIFQYLNEAKPYHTNFEGVFEEYFSNMDSINTKVIDEHSLKAYLTYDRISCNIQDIEGGYDDTAYDDPTDSGSDIGTKLGYDELLPNEELEDKVHNAANRIYLFYVPTQEEQKMNLEELMGCSFKGLTVSGGDMMVDEVGYDIKVYDNYEYDALTYTNTFDIVSVSDQSEDKVITSEDEYTESATVRYGITDFQLPYTPFNVKKIKVDIDNTDIDDIFQNMIVDETTGSLTGTEVSETQTIGTGTGTETVFTETLRLNSISTVTSITVDGTPLTNLSVNGSGDITADELDAGEINHIDTFTGIITLTFNSLLPAGQSVIIYYTDNMINEYQLVGVTDGLLRHMTQKIFYKKISQMNDIKLGTMSLHSLKFNDGKITAIELDDTKTNTYDVNTGIIILNFRTPIVLGETIVCDYKTGVIHIKSTIDTLPIYQIKYLKINGNELNNFTIDYVTGLISSTDLDSSRTNRIIISTGEVEVTMVKPLLQDQMFQVRYIDRDKISSSTLDFTKEENDIVLGFTPIVNSKVIVSVLNYDYIYDKMYTGNEQNSDDWMQTSLVETILDGDGYIRPLWERSRPEELVATRILEGINLKVGTDLSFVASTDGGYDTGLYDLLDYDILENADNVNSYGPNVDSNFKTVVDTTTKLETKHQPQSNESLFVFQDGLYKKETTGYTVDWSESLEDEHISNPKVMFPIDSTNAELISFGFGGAGTEERELYFGQNTNTYSYDYKLPTEDFIWVTVDGVVADFTILNQNQIVINSPAVSDSTVVISRFLDNTYTQVRREELTGSTNYTLTYAQAESTNNNLSTFVFGDDGLRLRSDYYKLYFNDLPQAEYKTFIPSTLVGDIKIYAGFDIEQMTLKQEGVDYIIVGDNAVFYIPLGVDNYVLITVDDDNQFNLEGRNQLTVYNTDPITVYTINDDKSMGWITETMCGQADGTYSVSEYPTNGTVYVWFNGIKKYINVDFQISGKEIIFKDLTGHDETSFVQMSYVTAPLNVVPIAYRMLKDAKNDWMFLRIADQYQTTVIADVEYDASVIKIRDASVLGLPNKSKLETSDVSIIGTGDDVEVAFINSTTYNPVSRIEDIKVDGISLTNLFVDYSTGQITADELDINEENTITLSKGIVALTFLTPIGLNQEIVIAYKYKTVPTVIETAGRIFIDNECIEFWDYDYIAVDNVYGPHYELKSLLRASWSTIQYKTIEAGSVVIDASNKQKLPKKIEYNKAHSYLTHHTIREFGVETKQEKWSGDELLVDNEGVIERRYSFTSSLLINYQNVYVQRIRNIDNGNADTEFQIDDIPFNINGTTFMIETQPELDDSIDTLLLTVEYKERPFTYSIAGEQVKSENIKAWLKEQVEIIEEVEEDATYIRLNDVSGIIKPGKASINTPLNSYNNVNNNDDKLLISINSVINETITVQNESSLQDIVDEINGNLILRDNGLTATYKIVEQPIAGEYILLELENNNEITLKNTVGFPVQSLFGGYVYGTATDPMVTVGGDKGMKFINGSNEIDVVWSGVGNMTTIVNDINIINPFGVVAVNVNDRIKLVTSYGIQIDMESLNYADALTELGIDSVIVSTQQTSNASSTPVYIKSTKSSLWGSIWVENEIIKYEEITKVTDTNYILKNIYREQKYIDDWKAQQVREAMEYNDDHKIQISTDPDDYHLIYPVGTRVIETEWGILEQGIDYVVLQNEVKIVMLKDLKSLSVLRIENTARKSNIVVESNSQTNQSSVSDFLLDKPGSLKTDK